MSYLTSVIEHVVDVLLSCSLFCLALRVSFMLLSPRVTRVHASQI